MNFNKRWRPPTASGRWPRITPFQVVLLTAIATLFLFVIIGVLTGGLETVIPECENGIIVADYYNRPVCVPHGSNVVIPR